MDWIPIAWRRGPAIQATQQHQQHHYHSRAFQLAPLTTQQLQEALLVDWKVPRVTNDESNHPTGEEHFDKGYYITGRLNTTLYHGDCTFEGPDPDLPIRGVRKYARAAAQLFCFDTSWAELLSLQAITETKDPEDPQEGQQHNKAQGDSRSRPTLMATWRLQAHLRLPWHPPLPLVYGTTTYYTHVQTGRITHHVESWDNLTPWQAFVQTLLLPHQVTVVEPPPPVLTTKCVLEDSTAALITKPQQRGVFQNPQLDSYSRMNIVSVLSEPP